MVSRRRNNHLKLYKLLVLGIMGIIAILASGYGVHSYTSSPIFCSSCHEMKPEYISYTQTAHNEIRCVDCHDKPGLKNIMANKINLAKEIYSHYKGIPTQILQTKARAVPSENCLQCHSKNRLVTATGDLKVNHPGHTKQGIPCITCHAGVVHSKMAERALNTTKNQDKWTSANAKKLIEGKYVNPNMGTCIDCHDKVNKGEKPWNDINYVMPSIPRDTNTESTTVDLTIENIQATQDKKTQELILQAIGKQKKNVKISMECTTCHKIVKIPAVHKNTDWTFNHGSMAMQELDKCLNCHQDSKWVREVPKEDIISMLEAGSQKIKYTPNYELVKERSRTNKFCSTCHASKPPSHTQTNWAPGHVLAAITEGQKLQCYICHDKDDPKTGSTTVKAPAESCQHCHKYFD